MLTKDSIRVQHAAACAEAEAIVLGAQGRDRTPEEEQRYQAAMTRARHLEEANARLDAPDELHAALTQLAGGQPGSRIIVAPGRGKSVGTQFVEQAAMSEWLKTTKGSRSGAWRSPTIELNATTLTSDPASGGDLVVPDYRPGIVPSPLRRPTIAELLASSTTDSNTVVVMHETSFTNAAAATAEGALKPESTLVFDAVSEAVRKVACFLPVADEMLDDVPALRGYLDTRLMAGVRVALDAELLTGSGIAPHLLGLLNRPGLTATLPVGTMTPADAIATQAATIEVATEGMYVVDSVVLHPLDFLYIVLAKTTDKAYISGGPFEAVLPRRLWGLTVALSTLMTRGVALIGAFKTAAQYFERSGIRVQASNSHQDWFQKDLLAIRAETRGALCVYRSQAFGLVSGIVAPTMRQEEEEPASRPPAKK